MELNGTMYSKAWSIPGLPNNWTPPGLGDFLSSTKPKAYLNYLLLDEQLKPVVDTLNFNSNQTSGFDQVGDNEELKTHLITGKEITRNGYLYIYVSNETRNLDVFFDNVQVTHIRGPLTEETHYYPFGLTMAGISSKAAGGMQNRYKFNDGTELNETFSLNLYETPFRGYDVQLGRFQQIDPFTDAYDFITPYQFAFNNPNIFNDPSGAITNNEFNSIVDNLRNSQYGGNWSTNGGTNYFNSDAEAFSAGADYMSQYGLWGTNGFANLFVDAQNQYYSSSGKDQGIKSLMQPIIVYGKIKNGKWKTDFVDYSRIKASFLNGDYSAQDLINIGLSIAGAGFSTMEAMLRNEREALYARGIQNRMNSFYRRQISNLDGGISRIGKLGKKIGVVGAGLTVASLGYKYFNGGITRKDAFDAAVSGVLLAVSVSNPVGLVALGLFGLFDSIGAFDGIKESIGADNSVILKNE